MSIHDRGGGTFDGSLLTIEDNISEVKASAGDIHLGGENLDNRILGCCTQGFRRKDCGKGLSKNHLAPRRAHTGRAHQAHLIFLNSGADQD